MDMKAQWQGWAQQIAALSLRERILILLTGVVLLGAMGIYGWLDDADTRLGQDRQALAAAQRDLEILTLENQGKQKGAFCIYQNRPSESVQTASAIGLRYLLLRQVSTFIRL